MAFVRRRALTCQEAVELVTDYLEGALAPAERQRFERHLLGCGDCSRHLEQLRDTLMVLAKLRED